MKEAEWVLVRGGLLLNSPFSKYEKCWADLLVPSFLT